MVLTEEKTLHSCTTILYFLNKTRDENTPECDPIRILLTKDLIWRMNSLGSSDLATFILHSWFEFLPDEVRLIEHVPHLSDENLRHIIVKQKKDVGIVVVLKEEKEAILLALGQDSQSEPDLDTGLTKYWFCEISNRDNRRLSIVVALVGNRGNIPCAITVTGMMYHFEFSFLCMVGIAAGVEKIALGDVVWSEAIYDYEHCRMELERSEAGKPITIRKERPFYMSIYPRVHSEAENIDTSTCLRYLRELIERAPRNRLPDEFVDPNYMVSIHRGNIAAGEVLFTDKGLDKMQNVRDEMIRAGDQEDSGFSQAVMDYKTDWLVFRGISDHGDPLKPTNDEWHFAAALSAAATCVVFLKQYWRGPTI